VEGDSKNVDSSPHSPPEGDEVGGSVSVDAPLQEEKIYAAYPRKVGKPAALRAIRRAIGQHGFDRVLERTQAYASARGGDLAYMPNPSTWFNEQRYDDDPATWLRSNHANIKPAPKIVRPDTFGQGVTKL
jgi:hypothetical protein